MSCLEQQHFNDRTEITSVLVTDYNFNDRTEITERPNRTEDQPTNHSIHHDCGATHRTADRPNHSLKRKTGTTKKGRPRFEALNVNDRTNERRGGGGVVEAAERPRGDIEGKHPRGQPTGQPTGRPRGAAQGAAQGATRGATHGVTTGAARVQSPARPKSHACPWHCFGQRRDILRIRGNPGMGEGRGRRRGAMNYNRSRHSTLGATPEDVWHFRAVPKPRPVQRETFPFEEGDRVRVLLPRGVFDKKAGAPRWSTTVYTIGRRDGFKYFIKNTRNEELKTKYRPSALKKVTKEEEEVLRTKEPIKAPVAQQLRRVANQRRQKRIARQLDTFPARQHRTGLRPTTLRRRLRPRQSTNMN